MGKCRNLVREKKDCMAYIVHRAAGGIAVAFSTGTDETSSSLYFAQPDLGRSIFASASLDGPSVIHNKEASLGFVYVEF